MKINEEDTQDKEMLFEQYKLYVEMMDRMSQRRINTSSIYISIITILITVIAFFLQQSNNTDFQKNTILVIGITGIILNIIWIFNIRSFKQINKLKFQVINEIEEKLSLPCYKREWEILKEPINQKNKSIKKLKYLRTWNIEIFVPMLLSVPFIIMIILFMNLYSTI